MAANDWLATLRATLPKHGLTPREAAEYLRRSRGSILGMIHRGELKAMHQGNRFVILPCHLADYIRDHTTAPAPKPVRRRQASRPSLIDQLMPE